ncbi:NAD/NADP octopine/nopaline dehydrogenase family protein [Kribbella sp. HUAS MG21]|uniref:NAD/NADP octopine/nopaline dehydrogenase family protein n=1 Tax=Kribbella sp. HUAS MG21 TaxID=3160966 RepID=A0AAU7T634_9ACTN
MRFAVLGDTDHALFTAAAIAARTQQPISVGSDRRVRVTALGDRPIEVVSAPQPEADAYVVLTDAASLLELIARYADLLADRAVLLVAPGVGGSALVHARLPDATIAETNANPFMGSISGSTVTLRGAKRGLLAGDLHPGSTAAEIFAPALDLVPATAVESSLANTNHVLHPALVLTNLSRIVNATPFTLFREGMSAATERLVVATDNERAALAAALEVPYTPVGDWFTRFYGDQGCVGATLTEAFAAFPPFATAAGPTTLGHRFLTDDVTCGLAVLEEVARRVDVRTPVTTSTVTALSAAAGTDLRATAGERADALLRHR